MNVRKQAQQLKKQMKSGEGAYKPKTFEELNAEVEAMVQETINSVPKFQRREVQPIKYTPAVQNANTAQNNQNGSISFSDALGVIKTEIDKDGAGKAKKKESVNKLTDLNSFVKSQAPKGKSNVSQLKSIVAEQKIQDEARKNFIGPIQKFPIKLDNETIAPLRDGRIEEIKKQAETDIKNGVRRFKAENDNEQKVYNYFNPLPTAKIGANRPQTKEEKAIYAKEQEKRIQSIDPKDFEQSVKNKFIADHAKQVVRFGDNAITLSPLRQKEIEADAKKYKGTDVTDLKLSEDEQSYRDYISKGIFERAIREQRNKEYEQASPIKEFGMKASDTFSNASLGMYNGMAKIASNFYSALGGFGHFGNNAFTNLADSQDKAAEYAESRSRSLKDNPNSVLNQIIDSTFQSVPRMALDVVLAMMTGGATSANSLAKASLAAIAPNAATTGGYILSSLTNRIGQAIKLPKYMIPMFADQAISSYRDAIADGKPQWQALTFGIANGYLNALLEGGGIEESFANTAKNKLQQRILSDSDDVLKKAFKTTANKLSPALKEWASSTIEEGLEEVTQSITEKALRNILLQENYGKFFKTGFDNSDDNAFINLREELINFAGGALGGAAFGGINLASSIVNNQVVNSANKRTAIKNIDREISNTQKYISELENYAKTDVENKSGYTVQIKAANDYINDLNRYKSNIKSKKPTAEANLATGTQYESISEFNPNYYDSQAKQYVRADKNENGTYTVKYFNGSYITKTSGKMYQRYISVENNAFLRDNLNTLINEENKIFGKTDINETANTANADNAEVMYSVSFDENGAKNAGNAILSIVKNNIDEIPSNIVFDVSENVDISAYRKKSDYILDIFNKQGNIAHNSVIGDVELNRSGAKSTVIHGFGNIKFATVGAIKNVIENGIIINHTEKYNNSGVDRYIIAAKGKIGGEDAVIGVVVKSYPNGNARNKFYLHEAAIIKRLHPPTAPQSSVDTVGETASGKTINVNPNNSIPQNDSVVNNNSAQNEKNNSAASTDEKRHFNADYAKSTVREFGQILGVNVEFSDNLGRGVDGMYITRNGKPTIIIANETSDPIMTVFKHELTHSFQVTSPEAYAEYKKYVIDKLKAFNPEMYRQHFDSLWNKYCKAYNADPSNGRLIKTVKNENGTVNYVTDENGMFVYDGEKRVTAADIEDEIAARATESFLTDEKGIAFQKMADKNPNAAKGFINALRSMILRLVQFSQQLKERFAGAFNTKAETEMLRADINTFREAERMFTDMLEGRYNANAKNVQDVNTDRSATENAETEIISVDTKELPVSFNNINEARKQFVDYARDNFPKTVVNNNTNAEIGISRTGIDKFLSGNISIQKYATGFKIPELIRTAKKVGEAENKKGKDGIKGYEYYDNSISIDGNSFNVHIRVRNTDMGDKYYGHTISQDVDEIKIEPLAWNSENKSVHSINASGSSDNSISQNDNIVNSSIRNNSGNNTAVSFNAEKIDGIMNDILDYSAKFSGVNNEKMQKIVNAVITLSNADLYSGGDISADIKQNITDSINVLRDSLNNKNLTLKVADGIRYIADTAENAVNAKPRLSISDSFANDFKDWIKRGKPDREILTVGKTSDALKSIGVKNQTITWDTSKINKSLKKHLNIDENVIEQIPNVLEYPILVMQSKQFDSRIVLLGEVYDKNKLPVMAILELQPLKDKSGVVLDEIKVASTYSKVKKNDVTNITPTQNFINSSDILYIEPNKKRTDNWLMRTRLQLPFGITNYGSIRSITYPQGNVNTNSMQKSDNYSVQSDDKPKFSLAEPIEETKNLIAVHNLSAEKLEGNLELGGIPMPSIAVTKADIGHTDFGDITLLFRKDTIDPELSKYNKLYGGDAYTPMFPTVDYEVNKNVVNKIRNKYSELSSKYGDNAARALYKYSDPSNAEDTLNFEKGEKGLISNAKNDVNLMQTFLYDKGIGEIATVEKKTTTQINEATVKQYDYFIEKLGKSAFEDLARRDPGTSVFAAKKAWIDKYMSKFDEAMTDYYSETFGFTKDETRNILNAQTNASKVDMAREILKYIHNGKETVKTEPDYAATNEKIRKTAKEHGYDEWVEKLFSGIEKGKGIYNGKDPYTPSGNKKSFAQLHDEFTIDNVVSNMRKQLGKGQSSLFSGANNVQGAATKGYKSISEMKQDSKRLLKLSDEEINTVKSGFSDRLSDIIERACKYPQQYGNALNDFSSIVIEGLNKTKSPAAFRMYLTKESDGIYNITKDICDDILSLVNDMREVPVKYFEAKPYRAINFNEVEAVIVPDSIDESFVKKLENKGLNVVKYGEGENDRVNTVNEVADRLDVKFSLADDTDVFKPNEAEAQRYAAQVDNWLNGKMKSSDMFELGRTPVVLRELGARDLPIVMSQDVMVKVTGEKHSISLDELKQLPQAIADPIMTFKSATVNNAYVILTELTDKHGNDVVVAMHLGRKRGFNVVNNIASVYRKENIGIFVKEQINLGNLKYIDKNKSHDWLRSRGLQLPKLNTNHDFNNSILQKEDIVNRYSAQNINKNTDKINNADPDKHIIDKIISGKEPKLSLKEEKAYKRLEDTNKLLKEHFKLTPGEKVTEEHALKLAKKYVKQYGLVYDTADYASKIKEVINHEAENAKNNNSEYNIFEELQAVNAEMLENAKALDTTISDQYKDLAATLKKGVQVSDEMKSNITDYKNFKASIRNSLTLKKDSGADVDKLYQELAEQYPEFFGNDIINPVDRLFRLAEVSQAIKPQIITPEYGTSSINDIANIVTAEMLEELTPQTKMGKRVNELKYKLGETKRAMRAQSARLKREGDLRVAFAVDKEAAKLEKYKTERKNQAAREYLFKALDKLSKMDTQSINNEKFDSARKAISDEIVKINENIEKDTEKLKGELSEKERSDTERHLTWLKNTLEKKVSALKNLGGMKADGVDFETQKAKLMKKIAAVAQANIDSSVDEINNLIMEQNKKIAEFKEKLGGDLPQDKVKQIGGRIKALEARRDRLLKQADKKQSQGGDNLNIYKALKDSDIDVIEDFIKETLNLQNDIRTYGKALKNAKTSDLYLIADKIAREQEEYAKLRNGKKGHKQRTFGDRLKIQAMLSVLSPMRVARMVTGYNKNSELMRIFNDIDKGQEDVRKFKYQANKMFEDAFKNADISLIDTINKLSGKKADTVKIKADGKEYEITKGMRVSLYLHSLNESNMFHIEHGGIIIPSIREFKKGKAKEAFEKGTRSVPIKLTADEIAEIISGMSKEEKLYAEVAHKFFNEKAKNAINARSEYLVGYDIADVVDYFPIVTERTVSDIMLDNNPLLSSMYMNSGGEYKEDRSGIASIEGRGEYKSRMKGSSNPIMLEDAYSVVKRHIRNTAQYYGMSMPLRNLTEVLNTFTFSDGRFETVSSVLEENWGANFTEWLVNLRKDLNFGRKINSDTITGKVINRVSGTFAGAVLTGNLSVILKQTASYPTAIAELGPEAIARGFADMSKITDDFINSLTGIYAARGNGVSDVSFEDVLNENPLVQKSPAIVRAFAKGIETADKITVKKLFKAAMWSVKLSDSKYKNMDMKTAMKSDDFKAKVVDAYIRTVENTQPMYDTMQRNVIQRTPDKAVRFLFPFMTQRFQNLGIMIDAIGNYKAKRLEFRANKNDTTEADLKEARKRFVWAVQSRLIASIMITGINALWKLLRDKTSEWKDDDDETDKSKVLAWSIEDFFKNNIGDIPYGNTLYSSIMNAGKLIANAFLDKYDSEFKFDVGNPFNSSVDKLELQGIEVLNDLISLPAYILVNREKKTIPDIVLNSATYAARFVGFPADSIRNIYLVTLNTIRQGMKKMGKDTTEYDFRVKSLEWKVNEKNASKFYEYSNRAFLNYLKSGKKSDLKIYNDISDELIKGGISQDKIESKAYKYAFDKNEVLSNVINDDKYFNRLLKQVEVSVLPKYADTDTENKATSGLVKKFTELQYKDFEKSFNSELKNIAKDKGTFDASSGKWENSGRSMIEAYVAAELKTRLKQYYGYVDKEGNKNGEVIQADFDKYVKLKKSGEYKEANSIEKHLNACGYATELKKYLRKNK